MAPSSSQMRSLVSEFLEATGASERIATKYLKSAGYRLNEAVDSFFTSNSTVPRKPNIEPKLNALFDSLRESRDDEKDKLELESTMSYLQDKLKVSLENAELFVVLEIVQAPSVGEITRAGFVDGWKQTSCDATIKDQAAFVRQRVTYLSTDTNLFKKVYRYTFVAGRDKDQKALSLENAMVYWEALFSKPGWEWKSKNHDWLSCWKKFLSEKWTRSVNRDMWNMTLEFALKSSQDETLSFWSEEGAWPSVIDDFVEWCRQQGIAKSESMDVDAGI